MHQVTSTAAQFMAAVMADDPKMSKAHETSSKRLGRVIKKLRSEGMSDLQIGVMLGHSTGHLPMAIATLSMLAEIEDVA